MRGIDSHLAFNDEGNQIIVGKGIEDIQSSWIVLLVNCDLQTQYHHVFLIFPPMNVKVTPSEGADFFGPYPMQVQLR